MTTDCARIARLLDAFLDEELRPELSVEVHDHLSQCERCNEHQRTLQAIRQSVQHVVRLESAPGADFAARMARVLAEERQDEENASPRVGFQPLSWRTVLPIAAAAAIVLFAAGLQQRSQVEGRPSFTASVAADVAHSVTPSVESLLDHLIDFHAAPPAPEVTEPQLIPAFERDVGVRVSLPHWASYGAEWQGGNVVAVRPDRRAASLRYRLSNHRITVYVYNSDRLPLQSRLEPRVVRDRPVYVGNHRGYSIAALERGGVGYALATDLNDVESAELIAAIH